MHLATAGRIFAPTAPREGAMRLAPYQGRDWWHFDCRAGDRPAGDSTAVDRVRLDGWPDLLPPGRTVTIDFVMMPLDGFFAERAGDWTVFFELHGKNAPGAGPLKLSHEWSAGLKRGVFRATRQWMDGGAIRGEPLFTDDQLSYGSQHKFRVVVREHPTDGLIRVEHFNRVLADYRGPFGYGPKYPLYPQFGIYRNTRPGRRSTARMRIDGIAVGEA